MGRVPPPREPSGCLQAAVISRMIAQILFVPLLLILGGVLALVFAFYAYAEHPLYGLAILGLAFAALVVIARWEYERAKRGLPPPEEVDWLDPRNR